MTVACFDNGYYSEDSIVSMGYDNDSFCRKIAKTAVVLAEGGIAEQTRIALGNMESVLFAAGTQKEDVVLCRVYIPDISLWDEANTAYAEFFGIHKPARVMVPTTALHHGALVEIEAIAEMEE